MVRAILNGVIGAAILMICSGDASLASEACGNAPETMGAFEQTSEPAVAPSVAFLADGKQQRTFADYEGNGLVVNLWATWCAPCVREMPSLDRLSAELANDGISVLALSSDRSGAEVVDRFYANNGIKHLPVLIDERSQVARAFEVRGLPTTILIDARGREVGRVTGVAEWDTQETVAFLRRCLTPRA